MPARVVRARPANVHSSLHRPVVCARDGRASRTVCLPVPTETPVVARCLDAALLCCVPTTPEVHEGWEQLSSLVAPFGLSVFPWPEVDHAARGRGGRALLPRRGADSLHVFVKTESSGLRTFVHCLTRRYPVVDDARMRVVRLQMGAMCFGRDDAAAEVLMRSPLHDPAILCVHTETPCLGTMRRVLATVADAVPLTERFNETHVAMLHAALTHVTLK